MLPSTKVDDIHREREEVRMGAVEFEGPQVSEPRRRSHAGRGDWLRRVIQAGLTCE